MANPVVEFSDDQWAFLAVLDAFGGPVSIEVAGILAPLLPGPLFDLLNKAEERGWIQRRDHDHLVIPSRLPPGVRTRLDALNTEAHLNQLLTEISTKQLDQRIGPREKLRILRKSGRIIETSEWEIHLAHDALNKGQIDDAVAGLRRVIKRLEPLDPDRGGSDLYFRATLELSNLCFALGQDFHEIKQHLEQVRRRSRRIDNHRIWALAMLHIGRVHFFADNHAKALEVLSRGVDKVQALGDEDILSQAAVFIGIFHCIRGEYREALPYFDKAEEVSATERSTILTYPSAPLYLAYTTAYLGHFHRAIGCLDFNWRQARDSGNLAMAAMYRAILGSVLLMLNKHDQAYRHFKKAEAEAVACNSILGRIIAMGGLAEHHFRQGRMAPSYDLMAQAAKLQFRTGMRHFSQPWVLEVMYEYHRMGLEPVPGYEFNPLIQRILSGFNVHLQGVAHRLRAMDKAARKAPLQAIEEELLTSKRFLEASGDPVQLSRTLFEMARLKLRRGRKEKASGYILEARRALGGYADDFFPDEFRPLASYKKSTVDRPINDRPFLSSYFDMIESLYPSEDLHDIQSKVLVNTSRMFGAERSGLFWFPEGKHTSMPELSAAINLTPDEVASPDFSYSLEMILQTQTTRQSQKSSRPPEGSEGVDHRATSILCLPLEFQGRAHGILYFDNSYLADAFGFIDNETMTQIIRHTNIVIERRMHFLKIKEQVDLLTAEKSARMEFSHEGFVARSDVMQRLLNQADQVAATESTVLILGETGTGKELLANRIHLNSKRSEGPNIIVDSTTIPETLMESELFGHEKGAFTGADKRKPGRIEIANHGTLFLDEIGELPLGAQAKLLRTLQEKTFIRVGGTRTLKSDFRLVAATNRNLEEEVAAGRFREDLYFRLNVIPLQLPPLRERSADIDLLAQHFLQRYASRYQRTGLALSVEHKKMLRAYPWPGNIRELKNVMERAVLLSGEEGLELSITAQIRPPTDHPFADTPSFREMQRRYIAYILERSGGKVGRAAERLGMKRTSLYTRMRILGMER